MTGGAAGGGLSAEAAARVALVKLKQMGPARASWLLASNPAVAVLEALAAGRLPAVSSPGPAGVNADLIGAWARQLRTPELELERIAADLERHQVRVLVAGDRLWPFALDPDPPAVLFCRGDAELLAGGPRVALVGTRRCTSVGRQVAHRFGSELAGAGIPVVSGLATGIDGAAHGGALAANGVAIGVVATGLDVVYPRANHKLWDQVIEMGLLVGEAPPGTRPDRWRFPARNRLIAALSEVTVVVESHARGGALLTASEAADRGRAVLAVPGAVTNPAAVGSNALLADGCPPACTVADIVDHLESRPVPPPGGRAAATPVDLRLVGSDTETAGQGRSSRLRPLILAEAAAGDVHVDAIVAASGASVPEVLAEVQRLVGEGLIRLDGSTITSTPPPP